MSKATKTAARAKLDEMLAEVRGRTNWRDATDSAGYLHGACALACRLDLISFDEWEAFDQAANSHVHNVMSECPECPY